MQGEYPFFALLTSAWRVGVVQDKLPPFRTWTRGDLQNFVFMYSLYGPFLGVIIQTNKYLFSLLHVQRYRKQAVQLVCPIQGVIHTSLDLLQIFFLKQRLATDFKV